MCRAARPAQQSTGQERVEERMPSARPVATQRGTQPSARPVEVSARSSRLEDDSVVVEQLDVRLEHVCRRGETLAQRGT
eukprot:13005981-Alexandrium_andersonii.AAC.1